MSMAGVTVPTGGKKRREELEAEGSKSDSISLSIVGVDGALISGEEMPLLRGLNDRRDEKANGCVGRERLPKAVKLKALLLGPPGIPEGVTKLPDSEAVEVSSIKSMSISMSSMENAAPAGKDAAWDAIFCSVRGEMPLTCCSGVGRAEGLAATPV